MSLLIYLLFLLPLMHLKVHIFYFIFPSFTTHSSQHSHLCCTHFVHVFFLNWPIFCSIVCICYFFICGLSPIDATPNCSWKCPFLILSFLFSPYIHLNILISATLILFMCCCLIGQYSAPFCACVASLYAVSGKGLKMSLQTKS